MESSPSDVLPCSVFGHNYVKSKTTSHQTTELICTHCKLVVQTDADGNFESSPISNKKIRSTLRQFINLKRRSSKLEISS